MSYAEDLNCTFKDDTFYFGTYYTCAVTLLDNAMNNMVISGNVGIHKPCKDITDVKNVFIHRTNTKYIPKNLGFFFNLTVLRMWSTQLVEIRALDFNGMENLELLDLGDNKLSSLPLNAFTLLTKLRQITLGENQIENIPNGLFTNNIKLEKIYLYKNKIKFIGSSSFDGLTKLNQVNLSDNSCIDQMYVESKGINELKNDIKLKCILPIDVIIKTFTKEFNALSYKIIDLEKRLSDENNEIQQESIKIDEKIIIIFIKHNNNKL